MMAEENDLYEAIKEIPISTILAGPWMTMFANIFDLQTSMQVLDRLIMFRSYALV